MLEKLRSETITLLKNICAKAFDGLTTQEEYTLFTKYNKLRNLLYYCNIKAEDMEETLQSLNEEQLKSIKIQIRIYNIMNDLRQGKNLLKEAETIKDHIFNYLEYKNPSGNYPQFIINGE